MKNHIIRMLAVAFACLIAVGSLAVFPAFAGSDSVFFESFESGLTGWESTANFSTTSTLQTKEYASDGSASVLLKDTLTDRSLSLISPKITPESGVYYRISVDVYNISGNGSVFLWFYDASNKQTDSVSTTVTATGKWSPAEFTVTLPEGASYFRILLYSGQANKGETCYDNIRVTRDSGESDQTVYSFPLVNDSYPRLYGNAGELSAIREAAEGETVGIAGYRADTVRASLIANADGLLTKSTFSVTYYSTTTITYSIPFQERTFSASPSGYSGSNYPYWQEMGNQIMEMLQTLSLAYVLTGNTAYGERAVTLAMSLADWSRWTEYPTINRTSLETGYLVTGVSAVCDLCRDLIGDTQWASLKTAMINNGLDPLCADLSAFTDHNYYVNKASALATGSLLLLGEAEDAAKYLSRAWDYFGWYLDERAGSDSQEGLSYSSYSMDLLFGAMDMIRRVTGRSDLLSHPYTETLFRWAVMTGRNGDGAGPPISDTFSDAYFFVTANVMSGTDVAGLANWYLSTRDPDDVSDFRKLIYFRSPEGLPVESPEDYTSRTGINLTTSVIDGIGWGSLRSGWEEDDLLLVCVANNSTHGHSHYDQNSFVLAVGDEWILSDPGYQDYGSAAGSDYTLSTGHSTMLVDGNTQSVKGNASIRTLLEGSAYAAIRGSAAGAYSETDVTRFDREWIQIRSGDTVYYVIADLLEAGSEHDWTWVLNADGIKTAKYYTDGGYDPLNVSGKTIGGSEFFVGGEKGALRIAFDREYQMSYDTCDGQGAILRVDGESSRNTNYCAVISALGSKSINAISVEPSVRVVQSYSGEGQTGVKTTHGTLSDLIAVSSTGTIAADTLTGTAGSASLIGLSESGTYLGYAATDCTRLQWQDKTIVEASSPVSVSVFFDGNESVLQGPVGTTVRLWAPNGIAGLTPDGDGYCTLTLTAEKTVLSVGKGSSDAPAESTTEPADPEKRGCHSTFGLWFLPAMVPAAVPCMYRKKRKK